MTPCWQVDPGVQKGFRAVLGAAVKDKSKPPPRMIYAEPAATKGTAVGAPRNLSFRYKDSHAYLNKVLRQLNLVRGGDPMGGPKGRPWPKVILLCRTQVTRVVGVAYSFISQDPTLIDISKKKWWVSKITLFIPK